MDYFYDLAAKEDDPEVRDLLIQQGQKADVRETITTCKRCSLYRTCRQRVPFHGDRGSVMILVESPSESDDRGGESSMPEKLLKAELQAISLEFSIVNVVCCRPPGSRTPLPREVEACSLNLRAQVEYLQPWLILCLGATPLTTLRPELRITRHRGYFFDIPAYPGIWGFSTFNPAYVLRNRGIIKTWRNDLATVGYVAGLHDMFGAELVSSEMALARTKFPAPSRFLANEEAPAVKEVGYQYDQEEFDGYMDLAKSSNFFKGAASAVPDADDY